MKYKRRYRNFLLGLLAATLIFSIGYSIYYIQMMVPNQIHIITNEEESFVLTCHLLLGLRARVKRCF